MASTKRTTAEDRVSCETAVEAIDLESLLTADLLFVRTSFSERADEELCDYWTEIVNEFDTYSMP